MREGLQFECQPECGRCCSHEREGEVFVEPADIESLSSHAGVSPQDFFTSFGRRNEEGELVLRLTEQGDCVFLDDGACGVYEARPLQCRTYPFLPLDGYSPVETQWTWKREQAYCPGIGKGRRYSEDEVHAIQRGRAPAKGFAV